MQISANSKYIFYGYGLAFILYSEGLIKTKLNLCKIKYKYYLKKVTTKYCFDFGYCFYITWFIVIQIFDIYCVILVS